MVEIVGFYETQLQLPGKGLHVWPRKKLVCVNELVAVVSIGPILQSTALQEQKDEFRSVPRSADE
jgi:hypothetical protein